MATVPTTEKQAPAEAPAEVLPAELSVKNISKSSLYLTFGEIAPGETGKCAKAEFENFVGVYLEKA